MDTSSQDFRYDAASSGPPEIESTGTRAQGLVGAADPADGPAGGACCDRGCAAACFCPSTHGSLLPDWSRESFGWGDFGPAAAVFFMPAQMDARVDGRIGTVLAPAGGGIVSATV